MTAEMDPEVVELRTMEDETAADMKIEAVKTERGHRSATGTDRMSVSEVATEIEEDTRIGIVCETDQETAEVIRLGARRTRNATTLTIDNANREAARRHHTTLTLDEEGEVG